MHSNRQKQRAGRLISLPSPWRRIMRPGGLILAALLVAGGNLAHARGGGGGAASGGISGGSVQLYGGNSGHPVNQPAAQIRERHQYSVQEQSRREYRYGSGSADLVRGRPDCGLGGPCQQPPIPTERPDYGHR